ncbi:hypothetical protein F4859DRAFT_486862 [Xylaria cf. heliscus]|nr:hypothetical protein F4859DRAFT_486862 [Xylaria cf. heliscus]
MLTTSGSPHRPVGKMRSVRTRPLEVHLPTRSRSSERGTQRPISGPLPQDQQASQASDPDTARTAPITLSLGGSSFMGLTLPPLPSAMLPMKKRPLDEVLSDETPPQQDKMSAEIDQLAEEAPLQPDNLSVGPSETHNVAPHRQKRSKNNEEPSTSQALPIVARNSATDSDGSERRPPERRPERVSEASRRGSRANPS